MEDCQRHGIDTHQLRQTDAVLKMSVKRLGQKVSMGMSMQSVESPDGQVVRFRSEVALGPTPTVTVGRVAEGKMHMTITTRGKSSKLTIPWSREHRGFFAVHHGGHGAGLCCSDCQWRLHGNQLR